MLWTREAPARREATTTTQDQARDGVPVGGLPPPNFLLLLLLLLIIIIVARAYLSHARDVTVNVRRNVLFMCLLAVEVDQNVGFFYDLN